MSVEDIANDIWLQFNNRIDEIQSRIECIKDTINSLEESALKCTNDINDEYDKLVQQNNTQRNIELKLVKDLENKHLNKLQHQLILYEDIETMTKETKDECMFILFDDTISATNRLFKTRGIINKANFKEEQMKNIQCNKINDIQCRIIAYSQQQNTVNLLFKVEAVFRFEYKDKETPINFEISWDIKHKIIMEYWFRTLLNISLILVINDCIHQYVENWEMFDSSLQHEKISITNNGKFASICCSVQNVSIFGTVIATPGGIYEWKLKIFDCKAINIGVIEADKCQTHIDQQWWHFGIGRAVHYNDLRYIDNIIAVKLNLIKNILTVQEYVEYGDKPKYRDQRYLKKNMEYRLGIATGIEYRYNNIINNNKENKQSIELIEFKWNRCIDKALTFKNKGNNEYLKNEFDVALEHYLLGLERLEYELMSLPELECCKEYKDLWIKLHCNVSLMYLKIGGNNGYNQCIIHCDKVLNVDRYNEKATLRKGDAFMLMTQYQNAKSVYHLYLKWDWSHKEIKAKWYKVKSILKQQNNQNI